MRTAKFFLLLVVLFLCPSVLLAQAPASDDTSASRSRDRNSGDSPLLQLRGSGSSVYVRFDLSRLPKGLTGDNVGKATARFFVSEVEKAGSFDVKRVTAAWTENTLDGDHRPTLGATEAAGVQVSRNSESHYVIIDITALVRDWLNNVQPNYGIALVTVGDLSAAFDSKENKNASHDPELNVVVVSYGPQGLQGLPGPRGLTGLQGPAGPGGPQGPQGTAGPAGPQGPVGKDGIQGLAGAQGPKGNDGAQGPQGMAGPAGPQGPAGKDGIQGAKGDTGAQGPQGATGPQGPTGKDGVDGAQGLTGPQGPQGLKGETGAQGPKGDTGAQGSQGPTGPKGDVGLQGPQGATGATGAAGKDGVDGAQGVQGPKGDIGATGSQGAKGDKGDTGATGLQGLKGDKGDTGATGLQGLKGDKGDTGATGLQGLKGDKGDTGANGLQGLQGEKGDVGPQGPPGPVNYPGPSSLSVTHVAFPDKSAISVNLTTEGVKDWLAPAGNTSSSSFHNKMLGGQMVKSFDFVLAGQSLSTGLSDFSVSSTSSDNVTGSGLSSKISSGVFTAGLATGFGYRFRAPANQSGMRRLKIYANAFSAGVTLTARLTDGSVIDAVDLVDTGVNAPMDFVWTIDYQSARDGQELEVSVILTANHGNSPTLRLAAATLQ